MHVFEFNAISGQFTGRHKINVANGHAITSMRYKGWFTNQGGARTPEILCVNQNNSILLLR